MWSVGRCASSLDPAHGLRLNYVRAALKFPIGLLKDPTKILTDLVAGPDHARCHLPHAAARLPSQGLLQPSPEPPPLSAPERLGEAPPRLHGGATIQAPIGEITASGSYHRPDRRSPITTTGPRCSISDARSDCKTMIDRYTYTERAVKPLSLKLNSI
jgi:hypothetical protein